MPETVSEALHEPVFDGEHIKTQLKNCCDESDKYGFEAFVVKKGTPKLKRMILDEIENDGGTNFKLKLKNMILEVIKDNYLQNDSVFQNGNLTANNQHGYLYFEQSGKFEPFNFLKSTEEITTFEEKDLSDASGLVFRLRKGNKELWLYQHMWTIMIPNKKKTNFMSRIMNFENGTVFAEQREPLLTIARKIDIIVMDSYIITDKISLLEKHFGFKDYIFQSAHKAVDKIVLKDIIKNSDKLNAYINRGVSKYSKKMMRISDSKVFDLSKEDIIQKIHDLPRWNGVFDIDEETKEITLNTYNDVENLIDLFDERYTRSDVTNAEYDTDVKSIATPIS